MIHPILLYGDPMLEKISESVPEKFPKLLEIVKDMYEIMHKANGIGLSAIQIGIPLQIFVIDANIEKQNFHFKKTFINPLIKELKGTKIKQYEGCLSVPQIVSLVERNSEIVLEYYDEKMEYHKETLKVIKHKLYNMNMTIYMEFCLLIE